MATVRYSLDGTSFFVDPRVLAQTPEDINVLKQTPLFTMRARLDDRDYTFRFDWCGREGRWYFALSREGVQLVNHVKFIADFPLLESIAYHPLAPKGTLIACDRSDKGGEPPTFLDFGHRVKLTYYPALPDDSSGGDLVALA